MKTLNLLVSSAVVMAAAVGPSFLIAQSPAPPKAAAPAIPALTAVQALPLTCAEAWIAAQKNYAQMRELVITLAKVSLVNRALTFPNQREAGRDAGTGIGADCKADPDALLFAVVDRHVRRLGVSAKP